MIEQIKRRVFVECEGYDMIPLYICFGGSHSWGLTNIDSDIDVKVIAVKSKLIDIAVPKSCDRECYRASDTIEGVDIEIEIWTIKKAMELLKKSNASIIEWMQVPDIIYDSGIKDRFLSVINTIHTPNSLCFHYYNMLTKNLKIFFDNTEEVLRKKYVYVLIPTFYLIQLFKTDKCTIDPNFENLFKSIDPPVDIKNKIEALIVQIRSGDARTVQSKIPEIDDWIQGVKGWSEQQLFKSSKQDGFEEMSAIPGQFSKSNMSLKNLRRSKHESGVITREMFLNAVWDVMALLYMLSHNSVSKNDVYKMKLLDMYPPDAPEKIIQCIKTAVETREDVAISNELLDWYDYALQKSEESVLRIKLHNEQLMQINTQKEYGDTLKKISEQDMRDMEISILCSSCT